MGSSTSSTTVAARSSVNSRNRSSAISLIMSAEGIITGGGMTVVSAMTVLVLVGEEICALRASSARRALRYAPRSPTLSYSSMKEEVMVSFCMEVGGCEGDGVWFVSKVLLLSWVGHSFGVWISAVEVGNKFGGVFQVLHGFPGAVTRGETLPLDKVV